LIAGSENTPEKRWPVEHWRRLIEALPDRRFILFGTAGDRPITAAIAAGFPEPRVTDLAGRTNLPGFAEQLRQCALLVTNDTGGMHLANAVGVPLVALFGPTNPLRTGPVFTTPADLLQPPGCPAIGGGSLPELAPATVVDIVRRRLAERAGG
jgi:ADP-heptose:LPS heptosyltransferase